MNYSEFTTLRKVEQHLGIKQEKKTLFQDLIPINPSYRLMEQLQDGEKIGLFSEKAKSEFIIAPILLEVWRNASEKISIFSGVALNIESANLNGYCDFILSSNPTSFELSSPIFCLVEAKNRTLEEGLGQCAAEMYAAYLFNEQSNNPVKSIHGCVTNGFEWLFLQLRMPMLFVDTQRFYLNQIPELLGAFGHIIRTVSYEQ